MLFKSITLKFLAVLIALTGVIELSAQEKVFQISGKVMDAKSGVPLPYVTVSANHMEKKQILAITTTLEDGSFLLESPTPRVFLEVSFIGYESDTLTVDKPIKGKIDIGIIVLSESELELGEAVVTDEISSTIFKLDKRIFNVGKDLSSTGASALEVLNNVPSVNVDIEGVITLRGNSGVQILIDGKPSVLSDGNSNALGTITADMIERVEVITNPSAKYDASGTSGILNIVLKKDEQKGLNGSISLNTGIPDNHSIGVSLNRRTEKFNLFTQLGAGYRSLPNYAESINENKLTGSIIESDGTSYRNEKFYNIRLGTDYHINDKNVLTLSGSFAYEIENNPSKTEFILRSENDGFISEWEREEVTSATNPKWQFDLQYKKEFKDNEDHTLLMSALGSFFGKDQSSAFTNTTIFGETINTNQRTDTKFQRADYIIKADYTKPIKEKFTLEAGAQYEINDVGNDFTVRDLVDGEFVPDPNLTNDFRYDQTVIGVYGTGSYEGTKVGVKLGLRMEYTDLETYLVTTDKRNSNQFSNLFPSVHSSYNISDRFSMQVGYSRRISRPRLWDLNPFFNITNNFNIRTGNPNLQPEFSDSYELTSILILKKASLNASVFHLYTTDVVERVSIFEDNVNTTTPFNIGTNASYGFEFNGKYNPKKWLTLTGDFNINYFERKGEFNETTFDFDGDRWNTRLTSKFKLPKSFELEVSGDYRSGYETIQGRTSGFASANLGVKKKIMKGKIVCNLSVRDLFASRIRESIIDQSDYYLYSFNQRGRFVTFGISYGFGKGEAMSYSGGRRR